MGEHCCADDTKKHRAPSVVPETVVMGDVTGSFGAVVQCICGRNGALLMHWGRQNVAQFFVPIRLEKHSM
jgi:hypothetical protein